MQLEILGNLTTVAIMALFCAFLVEAAKRLIRHWTQGQSEKLESLIPIPLAILSIGMGALCAIIQVPGFEELAPVSGGAAGFVAAALAAFGYDFLTGILKTAQSQ